MGLFDQILGAVANPQQQANPSQLAGILGAVGQLAGKTGTDPATINAIVSVLGNHVRSALQSQQATAGPQQANATVEQYSGTEPNPQAVQAVFGQEQQQVVADTAQQTGTTAATIQALLPVVIPIILNLLRSGASTQNPQQSNPVLGSFLDGDGDGDTDVADVLSMVGRFIR